MRSMPSVGDAELVARRVQPQLDALAGLEQVQDLLIRTQGFAGVHGHQGYGSRIAIALQKTGGCMSNGSRPARIGMLAVDPVQRRTDSRVRQWSFVETAKVYRAPPAWFAWSPKVPVRMMLPE